MKKKITVNSFFSGIGGFDLGFEKMGFKLLYQCEVNDFCVDILNKHWPKIKLEKDITKINSRDIPNANIWCGGFPCQDVSVARGSLEREGLKGKNSGLFYSFLELIKEQKPEIVLLENVTGLLNSHQGNDFKVILESLTSIGYGVSWRIFNSRFYGVPQSRPRVYICAWRNSLEKAIFALHENESSVKFNNTRQGFLSPTKNSTGSIIVPEISYCLAATSGRHTGTDWSRTYVSYYNEVRRLTPSEAEKLQGFPPGWTIPHELTAKKILDIDTLRYHAVGNAVSVPVVVWIADRIKKIKNKNIINRGIVNIAKKFEDFSHEDIREQYFSELNSEVLFQEKENKKYNWYSGGFAFGDKIIDSKVHACPTMPYSCKLIDLIDENDIDEKYFISSKAARGILRRVENQGRVLFKPLHKALERLSNIKNTVLD